LKKTTWEFSLKLNQIANSYSSLNISVPELQSLYHKQQLQLEIISGIIDINGKKQ